MFLEGKFFKFLLFLTFPRIPTLEICIVPNVCGGLIKTFSDVKYPSPHFWVTLSSMCGVEMREIRDCDNNFDFPISPRLTLTKDSIYNTKLPSNEKQKRMHLIFQCDPLVLCSVNVILSIHVGMYLQFLKCVEASFVTFVTFQTRNPTRIKCAFRWVCHYMPRPHGCSWSFIKFKGHCCKIIIFNNVSINF